MPLIRPICSAVIGQDVGDGDRRRGDARRHGGRRGGHLAGQLLLHGAELGEAGHLHLRAARQHLDQVVDQLLDVPVVVVDPLLPVPVVLGVGGDGDHPRQRDPPLGSASSIARTAVSMLRRLVSFS